MASKGNLIITRAAGESVEIGNATVRVMCIKDGEVRLSIQAPRDVPIVRDDAKVKEAIVKRVADQG